MKIDIRPVQENDVEAIVQLSLLARRSYEKAGYTGLPIVRYYKDLTQP